MHSMRRLKARPSEVKPILDRGGEIHVLISPLNVKSEHLIMGTATVPVGGSVERHVHDFSEECFFVLQGRGQISIEGQPEPIPFEPGEAVLTPRGAIHSIRNTGNELIRVVFAAGPLSPNPAVGHRILQEQEITP